MCAGARHWCATRESAMRFVAYRMFQESQHRLWRPVAMVDCYGRCDAKTWGAATKARMLGIVLLALQLACAGRTKSSGRLAFCSARVISRMESRFEELGP